MIYPISMFEALEDVCEFDEKALTERFCNDHFRRTFVGGIVVTSDGIQVLEPDIKSRVLEAVRNFDAFNESNGSRRLHNYGQLEVGDLRIWFIIDSPDVTIHYQNHDPNVDTRVLWILFPWEF